MKKSVLAAMGGVVAIVSATSADVVTQVQSFGPATPDYSQTLTFNKYAGPASEIIGITVRFQLDIQGGQLQLDNDNIDPVSGTATLGVNALLTSPDVPLLNKYFQPVVPAAVASTGMVFDIAGNDGDPTDGFDAGGNDTFTLTGSTTSTILNGDLSTALFANIAGGGAFNVHVALTQLFDFGGLSGLFSDVTPPIAGGNVSVTYTTTKDPVPAPASAALLALGGLVAFRGRRR